LRYAIDAREGEWGAEPGPRRLKVDLKVPLLNAYTFVDFVSEGSTLAKRKLERMRVRVGSKIWEILFRPGSTDPLVIGQVFCDLAYDLQRLRRGKDIFKFLDNARTSKKRPLIIDAGANIGASSIYLATLCPDGLVVALEPEAKNFELLLKNTKQCKNVTALQCALAEKTKRVRIIDPGVGNWGYRTEFAENSSSETVDCVTVSDIYQRYQNEFFPFLCKIDIEGGEKGLFSEDTAWVSATPVLIVELHDWLLPGEGTAAPFLECISHLDRDFVPNGENIFSISNDLNLQLPAGSSQDATQSSQKETAIPFTMPVEFINLPPHADILSEEQRAADSSRKIEQWYEPERQRLHTVIDENQKQIVSYQLKCEKLIEANTVTEARVQQLEHSSNQSIQLMRRRIIYHAEDRDRLRQLLEDKTKAHTELKQRLEINLTELRTEQAALSQMREVTADLYTQIESKNREFNELLPELESWRRFSGSRGYRLLLSYYRLYDRRIFRVPLNAFRSLVRRTRSLL